MEVMPSFWQGVVAGLALAFVLWAVIGWALIAFFARLDQQVEDQRQ